MDVLELRKCKESVTNFGMHLLFAKPALTPWAIKGSMIQAWKAWQSSSRAWVTVIGSHGGGERQGRGILRSAALRYKCRVNMMEDTRPCVTWQSYISGKVTQGLKETFSDVCCVGEDIGSISKKGANRVLSFWKCKC